MRGRSERLQDVEGEPVERVVVDLEQLVARIGLEHVQQRPAGIARGIEAGPRHHLGDLVAQIGDRAVLSGVGGSR